MPREGQSQPASLPDRDAVVEPAHRGLERALLPSEEVVPLADPVQADSDIPEPGVLDPLGDLLRDERAVRGDDRPDAELLRQRPVLVYVLPDERLAAREEQHRRLELAQVADHRLRLLEGQLVRVLLVLRVGVAVDAVQVAPPRHVPDDDRLPVGG